MFRQLGYRLSYLQVLDNLVSLGAYNHLVAIWVANLRVQDFYLLGAVARPYHKFPTIKTLHQMRAAVTQLV